MSRIVIVGYRPKPEKDAELRALLATHVSRLRDFGFVTDRPPVLMQSGDGSYVEVFEWVSMKAIDKAHTHPEVLAIWKEFEAVCDYVPVGKLAESAEVFAEFDALPAS